MMGRLARWFAIIPWLLLVVWFLLPTMSIINQMQQGEPLPPDLATYLRAADRLRRGEPLYGTPEAARGIWLSMHALERANYLADANASVAANIPGPYVYPPSLAVWLYWLGLQPAICLALIVLALLSTSTFWLYVVRTQPALPGITIPRSSWWLLLVIGSSTLLVGVTTSGNVEPLLIFVTLVAAWTLWRGQPLVSGPLIAFVGLIKPFYGLFFLAFGLLLFANPSLSRRTTWGTVSAAALLALLVVAVTVITWGRVLWQPTLDYLRNALDYHWFVLPVDQQTPLSIWNRTPLQGLVNWGMEPHQAQRVALGIWTVSLLGTLWLCWGRSLSFPLMFALALVLCYWGRPIGWGFTFLEIVVVLAAWPSLHPWQRTVLLIATLALMASHWAALVLTLQGTWLRLVTLQSAEWPWETWLVLPLAWLVLITAARWKVEHIAQTPT
jgi:hypothetical protein